MIKTGLSTANLGASAPSSMASDKLNPSTTVASAAVPTTTAPGKTVLITGASRGIGKACAQVFASYGYNVAVNYLRSKEAALELVEEIRGQGRGAVAYGADVADLVQVEEMCSSVLRQFGAIDVLVNNAGISRQSVLMDVMPSDWERMMAVNITGMFNCTQYVLQDMLKRKEGSIINISSIWGIAGASCEVPYSTSKAAVIGFTKALAKEVGLSGIRVNCVAPGVIDTDMNASLTCDDLKCLCDDTPLGRLGSPLEVAHCVYFLASDAASFITGQVISPNGGFVI